MPESNTSGTNTPLGESADEDFFSSWDKPTIIKPSNPPSRTGTPSANSNNNDKSNSRSASPFLNAPANGNNARPKSPLAGTGENGSTLPPAASRTTSSSAIRKTGAGGGGGARKANILGGGKKSKLGAKKVAAADDVDFEAAEKAAKEEAERIEKLGYDPNAEEADNTADKSVTSTGDSTGPEIVSPTPVSPGRGGFGSMKSPERNPAEVERLGMGVRKLGFGQTGSSKPAAASAPRKLGFGATGGGSRSNVRDGTFARCLHHRSLINPLLSPYSFIGVDSEQYARQKFGSQKGISSDEFFGRAAFDPGAQAEAKTRLQGFEGAGSISSNAYFGRPEDEMPAEEYGDLEGAAKDFVRKFGITASDDLDNLTHVLGEGATRLHGNFILNHSYYHYCLANYGFRRCSAVLERVSTQSLAR